MPGPPPKRSTQRRRRNKSETPIEKAPAATVAPKPRPDAKWHPVAKRWYEALGKSGQSKFYEPSDWATAWLIAEALSRDFHPQVVGFTEAGKPIKTTVPVKGASLAAYLKAMTALLVTEGDRRRARLELQRPGSDQQSEADNVEWIDSARSRLRGGTG